MHKASPKTLDQLRVRAGACLDDLLENTFEGHWRGTEFSAALEALPLTTAEISTARNRLQNARRYVECGEPGAARFELRMLSLQISLTGG